MIKKYKLLESTICLFQKLFDNYIMLFSEAEIEEYGCKLSVSAAVCMRLAIKFNESQSFLYEDFIPQTCNNDTVVCIHQDLVDQIALIMVESNFVDKPKRPDEVNQVFDRINDYILQKETLLLYANDFQLRKSTGFELLSVLLKISNDDHDFKPLLK